ncbi:GPO family capsid scaffolding protein [Pseudomonas sp. CCC4.1]|uniref:GPO family capsid scaffolding protein n=1 Tax=Pseudomonas sp. CCC4.1 TaxID=3048610 RepID=UPI002AB53C51|nr:GPO family capsid scaffolding protein [Pseudomonas sp. CCC4.1]MDY7569392.1 GPO family capsid scaffolding protein [Pseudomonas sp. CCC4.1]MEB0142476.1 GPO family capsid scaffolding protein [Pseudomonas sp. CCC4.1]
MPRSLVSFWKRVATSGPTVDGRVILPQELRDIAETYSIATYTASIWSEHERWSGAHGTVFAVRLVEDADDLPPGQVALEAQLKPNQRLLYLNDQGEKLFTSIEVTPDFANTGKAYLTGLAVTDSPASLGTQELYFSRQTGKPVHYAAAVPLGALKEEEPTGEMGKVFSMFSKLLKRFGIDEVPDDSSPTTTEENNEMDETTGTALKALRDQLLIIVAGLDSVIEVAAAEAPEPDDALIEVVQEAVDDVVTSAETEFKSKKQGKANKTLANQFAALTKEFNDMKNTSAGRSLPKTTGADTKKRVL